ncbi:GTPase-associated protein 1-related protein [Actinosynnema sp. NPDC059797]
MAVRQLHCASNGDGPRGVRVGAMTPGTPPRLVELAIRAGAYEPGPALLGLPGVAAPNGFPVNFGFLPVGRAGVVVHSRYAGAADRTGDHFAHALLFDDVERELEGLLPIDLWRSPAWVSGGVAGSVTSGELPELASLVPGDEAGPENTLRFAAGRTAGLERVLGATQRALVAGRGRLVLVVPDDRTAALWVAATCRSLPHPLGLAVSFTTYTARPEESTALVSCTTPDVPLPAYGDFTAIDLTSEPPPDPHGTRYASAAAQLWERGEVPTALRLAGEARPALAAADLEVFAVLLELVFDLPVRDPADQELLLAAARTAVERLTGRLPAAAWARLSDQVRDGGGPVDVTGWSEVLRAARDRREAVPAELFGAYFIAALSSGGQLWLPELSAADLEDVAEHVVVPALAASSPHPALTRLAGHRALVDALIRVLERRLANPREIARLATTTPPEVARLLAGRGTDRIRLLADLVLARNGELDPVGVMFDGTRAMHVDWRLFGPVLWPGDPSVEDAVRLVRQVRPQVLVDSGLTARIVARALDRAGADESTAKDGRLADELLRSPLAALLGRHDHASLDAARKISDLRRSVPGRGSERVLLSALAAAGSLPEAVGARLVGAAASFVLRADPALHRDLLARALDEHSRVFLPAYREAVRADLADAPPHRVAAAVVAWRGLDRPHTHDLLVRETLPDALRRRRGRFLDQVGGALQVTAHGTDVPPPKGGWARWWQHWRTMHERRGLLSLFRRRGEV